VIGINSPHAISSVVGDVVKLYGPNFSITLEEYFTQLEAMFQTARRAAGLLRGCRDVDLAEMRLRLLDGLSAVLEESADVAKHESLARSNPCGYHAGIVNALAPRDAIISFNYDCVMDNALREKGKGKVVSKVRKLLLLGRARCSSTASGAPRLLQPWTKG
jgi:hypothetical protein